MAVREQLRPGHAGRDTISWAVVALSCLAGAVAHSRGDDDDLKMRNLAPLIPGKLFRNPDAWKLLADPLVGGPGNSLDATFPSRNIILQSVIPVNLFPGFSAGVNNQRAADCWGYTSPSGREYALMGMGWGTSIVEVTDPTQPNILTTVPGSDSLWRDVTVIGTYAYAVTDQTGVGIQVIDLSTIDSGQVTLVRNFSQGGHTTTHSMVENADSGYLYLCGGNAANGGMIPASISSDPTFPTFAGSGWVTRYVHEAQVVTYTSGPYAGREIAFLFAAGPYYGYSNALAIADITDKNDVQTLSHISYPGMEFCHQGWISDDRRFLYVNDELDAYLTRIFDISDLSHPRLVSTFDNGLNAIDHNEYVRGRYLFQSNYTSGLRVWDLFEPLRPVEVAHIDTRPENNDPGYNGAWGNYPFFDSGTVIISDIQRGMFAVKLSLLEFTPTTALPSELSPGAATPVALELNEINAELDIAELMVSIDGGPFAALPLALQGSQLQGMLPALECGQHLAYYVRAETTDQREFVWPLRAPAEVLNASVQNGTAVIFEDDFQNDQGWTVQNTSLSQGAWSRGVPLYNGGHGAVIGDGDGSGSCFLTGPAFNEDVAGVSTRLISPVLDLSEAPEARISYRIWLLSMVGSPDELVTELSSDDGLTWTVAAVEPQASGGWRRHTIRVGDFITPTSTVRMRVSISDLDNSTTEAGLDGVRVWAPLCDCYANCDGSSTAPVLNVADFGCFLQRFAAGDPYANCDQSTAAPVLNVADFGCFLQQFAAGCP